MTRSLVRRWFGTPEPDLSQLPDGYPAHRIVEDRLPDGTEVRCRPILPDDAVELRRGLERLSERTRWLRFHAPVHELSDAEVRMLVDVDHHDREALVAEVRTGSRWVPGLRHWQPVGVARYARTGPEEAEVAIVVEDAWQGRGIGRWLLGRLVAAAREEGIRRLIGEVLAENQVALRLAEAPGLRVERHEDGTVVHLVAHLDEPDGGDAAR